MARCRGSQIGALLFACHLNRHVRVHITEIQTREDLELIAVAKRELLLLTCDCSVTRLAGDGSYDDALWDLVDILDHLSVDGGFSAFISALIVSASSTHSPPSMILPTLVTAVKNQLLTISQLTRLMSTPPFHVPHPLNTFLDVDVDRLVTVDGVKVFGRVERAVVRGVEVMLRVSEVGAQGSSFTSSQLVPAYVEVASSTGKENYSSRRSNVSIDHNPATNSSAPSRRSRDASLTVGARHPSFLASRRFSSVAPASAAHAASSSVISATANAVMTKPNLVHPTNPFYTHHILSTKQFSRPDLHFLFGLTQQLQLQDCSQLLTDKVICNLFYEPSTRTNASFETAMLRLGGKVVCVDGSTSSVAKGENISDTIRTLGSYVDAVVMRHPEIGSCTIAAKFSQVPVINAGDGAGEHPTQAFLDIYTIRQELGTVNGLTITFIGDLKNSRTIHSLIYLLSLYDVKLQLISPPSLLLPTSLKSLLDETKTPFTESHELSHFVVSQSDVMYVTRVQKERFTDSADYEMVKKSFCVTAQTLSMAKQHMVVMHPLPRLYEIDPEVDYDQRAAYFRQVKYGLHVRMALLALVLKGGL